MTRMTDEHIAAARRATDRARAVVKPGDMVSRTMCCDVKGTFKFTHWDGAWLCGATVSDCHAIHIYRLNGEPVSFADP